MPNISETVQGILFWIRARLHEHILRGAQAPGTDIGVNLDPARLAFANLVWRRFAAIADRFARLYARFRAGTLRPPRRRASPRAPRPAPAEPYVRLPAGKAWVIRRAPAAVAAPSQLTALLARPDMADFLAAAPQAARILRPLCHMLGIPLPASLALPPRPPRPRRLRPERPPREPLRQGKYPRFNPRTYSPGRMPSFKNRGA